MMELIRKKIWVSLNIRININGINNNFFFFLVLKCVEVSFCVILPLNNYNKCNNAAQFVS